MKETQKPLKILVLEGPNLNLLGVREPDRYGAQTARELHEELREQAGKLGVELSFFQSNHEGALVDRIHEARDANLDGILTNPAALTHTSVALRDALLAAGLPFVEVHVTNIHAREDFRRVSLVSDVASGVVTGFGTRGYALGLRGLAGVCRRGES